MTIETAKCFSLGRPANQVVTDDAYAWYRYIFSHLFSKVGSDHQIISVSSTEIVEDFMARCGKLVENGVVVKKDQSNGVFYKVVKSYSLSVNYNSLTQACFTPCLAQTKYVNYFTIDSVAAELQTYFDQLFLLQMIYPIDRSLTPNFRLKPIVVHEHQKINRVVVSGEEKRAFVSSQIDFIDTIIQSYQQIARCLDNDECRESLFTWLLNHPESEKIKFFPFIKVLAGMRSFGFVQPRVNHVLEEELTVEPEEPSISSEIVVDNKPAKLEMTEHETLAEAVREELIEPLMRPETNEIQRLKDETNIHFFLRVIESVLGEMIVQRNRECRRLFKQVFDARQDKKPEDEINQLNNRRLQLEDEVDVIKEFRKMAKKSNFSRINGEIGQMELLARIIYRERTYFIADIRNLKKEQSQLEMEGTKRSERRIDRIDEIIINDMLKLDAIAAFEQICFPKSQTCPKKTKMAVA